MFVGYLSHPMKFSSYLLCQDVDKKIVDFRMGGMVCLSRNESIWSVQWIVIPEML